MNSRLKVKTAFVLAGGKGERLGPLTADRPKPMVEVAGAPILSYHLAWLRANGIERAVVLTGYLHHVIDEYFSVPRIEGLEVDCIAEERPLGRGGAFRNGYNPSRCSDGLVMATNGDVITDQPIGPLSDLHDSSGALATILLTQLISPYGIVGLDNAGRISSFKEKPQLPYWINGGVYLLDASLFSLFPVVGDHETSLFTELAEQGRMSGFMSKAFWRSIESPKDLVDVGDHLQADGLRPNSD
jgi:NDP-sugar pyrophosphorylase family protein